MRCGSWGKNRLQLVLFELDGHIFQSQLGVFLHVEQSGLLLFAAPLLETELTIFDVLLWRYQL